MASNSGYNYIVGYKLILPIFSKYSEQIINISGKDVRKNLCNIFEIIELKFDSKHVQITKRCVEKLVVYVLLFTTNMGKQL